MKVNTCLINKIIPAPVNRFTFFVYSKDILLSLKIDFVVSNKPTFPCDQGCLPTVGTPKLLTSKHAFLGIQRTVLTSNSQFILPKAQEASVEVFHI